MAHGGGGGGGKSSAIDPARYASFGLTHVRYDADDPFAQLLALITLSPIFLLCAYTTIILYRRELTFINALVGQLGCEAVNWALKRLIRQPRPLGLAGVSEEGYGMPSSHAQFMGFFAAFFVAHFVLHHPPPRRPPTLINTMRRLEHFLSIVLIVVGSLAVCYSRYYLLYHTVAQILVGASIGLSIGLVYYYLTEHLTRLPLRLPAALASPATPRYSSPANSPRIAQTDGAFSSSVPSTPISSKKRGAKQAASTKEASQARTRRPSLGDMMALQPSAPLRQILLDHPLAIAFRIRDSWTVWPDGGIESEFSRWRMEWERRRPA
ncbi:hypothetical protein OC834_006572 [Tilletia horrida]|nr:hypothetical protein OC835_006827 [Tilletia horrida]KAK0521683.1 hypothetical protein OC834_006572 [Tilletia horrida]KAK0556173.1 hypothetical protein OC844_005930 [Tilletia horrida]